MRPLDAKQKNSYIFVKEGIFCFPFFLFIQYSCYTYKIVCAINISLLKIKLTSTIVAVKQ